MEYNYRQSLLMLLTSLLPYNVPATVVYIRDLMIVGWRMPSPSLNSLVDDVPMLVTMLLCIIVDKDAHFRLIR